MADKKKVHIISGGTIVHIRPHFSLAATSYGSTGRVLKQLCEEAFPNMDVVLHETRMAGGARTLDTVADVARLIEGLRDDLTTKVIFIPAAIADFTGVVDAPPGRLKTSSGNLTMSLTPNPKIIDGIRNTKGAFGVRKDIFLVSFKVTAGASALEQYLTALKGLKRSSSNLVFANDIENGRCMIVTPEESRYCETTDRRKAIRELVAITERRTHLTFTRSTIVAGDPVPWSSPLVPSSLRKVVDHCIERHAYQSFGGSTAGHFAVKIGENAFLTSRRKTNFNRLGEVGLVHVVTDGPDNVIAYGSRPSVGGQSQRIIFGEHPEYDCVVHFHCPIKPDSDVPQVSQREFECGSHECGQNTSSNLMRFGNLSAVFLKEHGPNIVFNHNVDPNEVIAFIEKNFELGVKTGGYNVTSSYA